SVLNGRNGHKLVRYIAGGTAIPVEGSETDPVNGKDIYTTLDVNIQDIAETALMKMMLQCQGPYGTAIVMETQTGKIKAMANLGRQKDGTYWEDDNYALRATEPGSTIKLATLLSVLESNSSKIDDKVEVGTKGRMRVAPVPKDVVDAERYSEPVLTVQECFAHSSNVGMSKLAYKAFGDKPEEFRKYLHLFRLDEKPSIDLANVPAPSITSFKRDEGGLMNMLWVSFGYGINISPLTILNLYNAVANNGRMVKPYLVSSIQSDGIIYRQFQPTVLEENLCSQSVISDARVSMEMVVKEGTARKVLAGMPFAVAGKTGTAHVSDGKIKYDDGVYQATFVGYFPADNPQYTCIVVIRTKPHDPIHFGGLLAAPVFREIATKIYSKYVENKNPSKYVAVKDSNAYFYAGFTPDIKKLYKILNISYADSTDRHTWGSVYAQKHQPVIKANNIRQQVMPNVRGMGLKDAVYLLENMGVKISVKGKGKIITQSVAPGTMLGKGITVMLELS
ncbi:MAG TPA: penicillin-binding transpeptidase domain-containing protein, partial [Chitinophagaceae bacterium]|nr:penicillin-binding transpeptidase domain-containing protein [Chitinophagaceae bacterium]